MDSYAEQAKERAADHLKRCQLCQTPPKGDGPFSPLCYEGNVIVEMAGGLEVVNGAH